MGRKYASERKLPRRDEQTHAAPETAPHRARKDRKRWCRGKVGVEHQPTIRLSRYGAYFAEQMGRRCSWRHGYRRVDGKVEPDLTRWSWSCWHERGCTECGKILDPFLRDKAACPDYKPREQT